MFRWVVLSLIIAMVAAVLGFGGLVPELAAIARVVFAAALLVAVIGFIMGTP